MTTVIVEKLPPNLATCSFDHAVRADQFVFLEDAHTATEVSGMPGTYTYDTELADGEYRIIQLQHPWSAGFLKIASGVANVYDSFEAMDASVASSGVSTILARIGSFTGSGVNTVLGFLKAAMSKSATTPSDLGGTYSSASHALEASNEDILEAIDGIDSSGGSITVLPASVTMQPRLIIKALNLALGEQGLVELTFYNADRTELDLSGKTLRVAFETQELERIATVESGDITVTGTGNNKTTFLIPPEVTEVLRIGNGAIIWALRDVDLGNMNLVDGPCTVRKVAGSVV